jgi:NADH-quinone oxidoreductase subunit A
MEFELNWVYTNYQSLAYLLILTHLIATIILTASYWIIPQERDIEKISPYECGFSPFADARAKFDVRFYLVAILFIIFDLEIMYLFPWVINIDQMTLKSFCSMIFFLIILTIGFIYEWKKGALEWE